MEFLKYFMFFLFVFRKNSSFKLKHIIMKFGRMKN